MKKILLILVILVAAIFVGCLSFSSSIKKSLAEIKNTSVNMETVEDGIYDGHSEMGPVIVDVRVHVENYKILKVDLIRHDCGLGHSADVIVEKMVEQNTYNVDAISGATVSSEIIKNAVNIALR